MGPPRDLKIGPYRVLRRLGAGGMGEVFLAVDRKARGAPMCVVVKRILPAFAQDPDFRLMFLNEARLASSLSHPNVARVLDCGIADGDYYLVVEYVHGATVARLLRKLGRERRLPLQCAVAIVDAVAAGLHHAHQRVDENGEPLGLVHRDVCPSNVLVGFDGEVKIIDFGIATAAAATRITRAGTIKGKAAYMSPEMCGGGAVDVRSDVYGLGVLLYETTTARRLFHGESELAIMNAVSRGRFAPPSQHIGDYPRELEDIVARALDLDPVRRFQSAEEVRSALLGFCFRAGLNLSAHQLSAWMRDAIGDTPHPQAELDRSSGGAELLQRAPSADGASTRRWIATVALAGAMGVAGFAVRGVIADDAPATTERRPPPRVEPVEPAAPPVAARTEAPRTGEVQLVGEPAESAGVGLPTASDLRESKELTPARKPRRRRKRPTKKRPKPSAPRIDLNDLRPPSGG